MESAQGGRSERSTPVCRHGHERPRVLRITTRFRGSDHADDLIRSTEALRARGFDTRLVWGGSHDEAVVGDPPSGMAHTYLPWLGQELHPGDDLRAAAAIAGIVRRWKPDVVHTHLAKAGALGRLVAIRARVPVVLHTFHDRAWRDDRSALRSAAFTTVERRLAGHTDALTTGSAWMRDELHRSRDRSSRSVARGGDGGGPERPRGALRAAARGIARDATSARGTRASGPASGSGLPGVAARVSHG